MTTTITTFGLNAYAIQAIATLHNSTPAAKADREITPILKAVELKLNGLEWIASATDRYQVAELRGELELSEVTHVDGEDPIEGVERTILIDSADWVDLAKRAKADLGNFSFSLSGDQLTVTNSYGLIVSTYLTVGGNFPPVTRLFPDADSKDFTDIGKVALDATKLARINKIYTEAQMRLSPADRRHAALTMRFTSSNGDSGKPGPIVITRASHFDESSAFRALLQPNLILS